MAPRWPWLCGWLWLAACGAAGPRAGQERPGPAPEAWRVAREEAWEWKQPARERLRRGLREGRTLPGRVLHLGDSHTVSPAYSHWALAGGDKDPSDAATLAWMHAGERDEDDGFHLATEVVGLLVSRTAAWGITLEELLAGSRPPLLPIGALLDRFRPQAVLVLIGTNDLAGGRAPAAYRADLVELVDRIERAGAVAVLTTLPPLRGHAEATAAFNRAIWQVGGERRLPVISLHAEIALRQPEERWFDTLMDRDGIHLSAGPSRGPARAENLERSGSLLRAWLGVRKVAELRAALED